MMPINVRPTMKNTCALIITFFPGDNLKALLSSLLRQLSYIIIVDNTPIQVLGRYKTFSHNAAGHNSETFLKIITNETNLGIAAALNIGMNEAMSLGYRWCAVFDQDSLPSQEYFCEMVDFISKIPKHIEISIVGCNYYKWIQNKKKVGYPKAKKWAYMDVPTVITSGSFIFLETFREVGPFREDFFMDHVDHEYCLRSRKNGFHVLLNPIQLIEHSVGQISFHKILGKWFETSNHSAERRYYWHRNLILLLKEYFASEPIWCLKMLFPALWSGIINIIFFEQMKLKKVQFCMQGLLHGFLNRIEIQ